MRVRRSGGRRRWLVALIGVLGAGISVTTWRVLVVHENDLVKTQFEADADARIRAVGRRLDKAVEVIHFLSAFYNSSRDVERGEFHEYTERILIRHRGEICALEWLQRVAATDQSTAAQQWAVLQETKLKDDGFGDLEIRDLSANGTLVTAADRTEYFPVFYSEPQEKNLEVMGLDVTSEPVRAAAVQKARDSGEVALSGPITPLQGDGGQPGLLIVAPVYRHDPPPEPAEDSGPMPLRGFVAAVVRIDGLMQQALKDFSTNGIDVELLATPPEGSSSRMHSHSKAPVLAVGHEWSIHCHASDAYVAARHTRVPIATLLVGLLITGLVTMYVDVLGGRTARVEEMVVRRAAEIRRANESLEQEIAERKRAEDVLRHSEALYSSLVENLPVQMLRKDLGGRFTFANEAFCQLLGRPLGEIIGKTDFDFYPREFAQKYRHDDQKVIEAGEVFEDVERNEKDGEISFVQVMKSPVRDAEGKIIGTQAIFWDVTKRKEAELALEQERYLLHALMDNLPHNIYFKDTASRFTRINRSLAEWFGLHDAAEALGKTDFDFFTDEHAQQARADELEVMSTGRPLLDREEKETWQGGKVTWATTAKLPLYDEEGRVVGTFGISRDITDKKQAAEALKAAKEAAETANRAKSDFLAHMSHEIRTPLNAIIGMTELVLDSELTASQQEYLRMVRESGESLLSVINDILDFSKIEAGKLELESVAFDLHDMLGDTMKSLALRAHGKGLELACQLHPDVPEGLVGDSGRLRQIVVNLVGNAIKFTERGEVVLDVQRESAEGDAVALHFAVSDTGIGIPEAKREQIFDVFEQADTSTTRRYGGTGLGLAIACRLVDCMGGRLCVDSEVGRGSTFHFSAQFALATEEIGAERPISTDCLQGLPAMVVDDNATNRRILDEMLRNWGMSPVTVSGADEALQQLHEAQDQGRPFRLVLTDANMPDVDGFTLAERIKRDDGIGSTVIMMLTSGDRPGDVARCEQLGVAAYLLKPIKQSELFDAIAMALGLTVAEDADADAAAGMLQELPPLRVLLAEDSLVNQKLAVGLLESRGHSIVVANNGAEAITALQSQRFDLVLMDVQMPEMDGLEATAAIRSKERQTGAHVPIIAMTAHAMKGDRERCLEAGMDEYVSKPIRARRLFDTIAALLGTAIEPESEGPSLAHAPLPESDALDWTEALRTVRGDHELLRAVIEAFLEESPTLLAAIHQAVAENDASALRVASHSLKGAVSHLGAARIVGLAYELEKLGQQGSLGDVQPTTEALEEAMAELTPVLLNYVRSGA